MSTFFSGSLDPFWPHVILLSVAILASFAVAIGIVMESPKWSVANALVVGGVALEAICTLLLFGFDEGISNAQQSKIIALETKLAPRSLNIEQQEALVAALKPFAGQQYALSIAVGTEPAALVCVVRCLLDKDDWKRHGPFGFLHTDPGCGDGEEVSVNLTSGIHIQVKPDSSERTISAVSALVSVFEADGFDVFPAKDPKNIPDTSVINIMVGAKL